MASVTDTFPTIPVTAPPAPPRPTRPRRRFGFFKKAVLVVLALAVLSVFGAIAYVDNTADKITRIASSELASLATTTQPAPGVAPTPVNFVVIATDDRTSLPEDWDDAWFGDFDGRRTDVIMLAHLIPGERIQLLSLPRDLRVDIDGHGINRLNASFVFGGPDLLVKTVQQVTGIPVHHYVEIDFGGFGRIVDSLGGVTVDFPYPTRDNKSGLYAEAGRQKLDGEMALAYARSRHTEILKDGDWQAGNGGDIARTQRQQELMILLFDQITSPSSAFNLPGFLPTLAENITVDEGLGLGLIAELGGSALSLGSGDIERATLPVKNHQGSDGRSYVVPIEDADAVLAAFLAGDPYPRTGDQ